MAFRERDSIVFVVAVGLLLIVGLISDSRGVPATEWGRHVAVPSAGRLVSLLMLPTNVPGPEQGVLGPSGSAKPLKLLGKAW